jgi:aspartyl-tRNA(Asn)/glutamyl-tRNA(Gln) amidotransferase subunit C
MAITRTDVEHVAHLARLGLDEDEVERMADQLNHILEAMESLKRLDTSAIPPTAQVIPLQTVMRDDVPRPSAPVEEILQNAPRSRDHYFVVPQVFDD